MNYLNKIPKVIQFLEQLEKIKLKKKKMKLKLKIKYQNEFWKQQLSKLVKILYP